MDVDLVVVPVECDGVPAPDVSGPDLENFEGFIYNAFPVAQLNLQVHTPIYSASCSQYEVADYDLPLLRQQEEAPIGTYYGGLMAQADTGYTTGGDPSSMDFPRTFASPTWRVAGLSSDLFSHEFGHAHGRPHTFEDPEYPYPTGDWCGPRRALGHGVRSTLMPASGWGNDVDLGLDWFDPSETFIPATSVEDCAGLPNGNMNNHNDFMSYTYPMWISAHTYRALGSLY